MKYVATINGKKYEVEVEKLEAYKSLDRNGVAAPAAPVLPASAPVQRPAAPAPAPVAAAPAPAPAPAAAPAPKAAAPAGATTVEAPMPGKILNIKVSEGQAVKFRRSSSYYGSHENWRLRSLLRQTVQSARSLLRLAILLIQELLWLL